mgnify:FL=1
MLRVISRILLLGVLLVTLSALAGYWYLETYLNTPLSEKKETQIMIVPSGANLTTVSTQLADQGLLTRPRLFVAYARLTHQTAIRVGEYQFDTGDTPRELLELLMTGKVVFFIVQPSSRIL